MPKTPEEIAAEQVAADKAAAEKAAAEKAAAEAANGFPGGTPLEHMTVEQQTAYWKHQARKHEGTAKARADYDDLKAKAEELENLKAESQTEQERALSQAREEARREGENLGAARYLTDAVQGRFQALTQKTDEEIATIFEHVDAKSFTDEKGDIDVTKLKGFAETVGGTTSSQAPADPVRAAMERQRQTPGGGHTGSIAEMQRQRVEELSKSKQSR
jgi:hypothetical protein